MIPTPNVTFVNTMSYSLDTGEGDDVLNYLKTFGQEGLKEILQDMVETFGDDFLTYLDLDLLTQVVITDVDAFTSFLMSK